MAGTPCENKEKDEHFVISWNKQRTKRSIFLGNNRFRRFRNRKMQWNPFGGDYRFQTLKRPEATKNYAKVNAQDEEEEECDEDCPEDPPACGEKCNYPSDELCKYDSEDCCGKLVPKTVSKCIEGLWNTTVKESCKGKNIFSFDFVH